MSETNDLKKVCEKLTVENKKYVLAVAVTVQHN